MGCEPCCGCDGAKAPGETDGLMYAVAYKEAPHLLTTLRLLGGTKFKEKKTLFDNIEKCRA